MSETKTPWPPGPWTAEESAYAGDWIIHDAEGAYLADVANGYISTARREAHAPRTEATARLIATAPEMAELLEEWVRCQDPLAESICIPDLLEHSRALLNRIKGD